MIKRLIIIYFAFYTGLVAFSQVQKIDSLKKVSANSKGEQRVNALNDIAHAYTHSNSDSAKAYVKQALTQAKKINYKIGEADSYNKLSILSLTESKFEESIQYSIDALKILESKNDFSKTAEAHINLANAYLNLNNFSFAINNYKKAANLYIKNKDSLSLAAVYNNIAVCYDNQEILDTAFQYYQKAYPYYLMLNRKDCLGLWFMNVGDLFRKQNKTQEALSYQLKAEPMLIEGDDKLTLMVLYSGLPYTYIQLKQYDKALQYAFKAVDLGIKLKSHRELSYAYMAVADVYEAKKDYYNQVVYFKKYSELKDSVFNDETGKTIAEMEAKYEGDKKTKEIELLNKDKQLQSVEISKHKSSRNFLIGIAFLALALIAVLSFAFKNKSKANIALANQKQEIELQKQIVDLKNKEIIDSITYAKYLQNAILPSEEFIKQHVPDSFILYKPKDIVAGDFYWAESLDDKFFIAAADSTGHGVPGAMVSVVCSNALNRSLNEFNLTDTGEILNKTRELVLNTFSKSSKDVKDGMDISLICIDKKNNELFWSGANNPLWILYPDNPTELVEILPNKQPIGQHPNPIPFIKNTIKYQAGMQLYLFTDGYADQFGGPKGKKLKYTQFKEFIRECHKLTPNTQKDALNQKFESWRGNLEQIDDVCLIGIKL